MWAGGGVFGAESNADGLTRGGWCDWLGCLVTVGTGLYGGESILGLVCGPDGWMVTFQGSIHNDVDSRVPRDWSVWGLVPLGIGHAGLVIRGLGRSPGEWMLPPHSRHEEERNQWVGHARGEALEHVGGLVVEA